MDKISVIVPTYKGHSSVIIAVKSILNQNSENLIEIIVVDDNGEGSYHQIETEKVLQQYIDNKDIIYIKHKVNKNGSAARNTGLKYSKGEYIVFLDDDDFLLPNYITSQISNIKKVGNDYGLSVASGYYVREDGKGYIKKLKFSENFLYNYLMDYNYFSTSAILFRREIVEKVNGFNEEFSRHQDWEFCTRVLVQTKATYINEPVFIKYAKNRNTPKSLDTMVEQLDYYFSKLNPILNQYLNKKEINDIKFNKYEKVFWNHVFSRKFKDGVSMVIERDGTYLTIIKYIINLIAFVIKRIFIGSRKVTYSYDEVKIKAGVYTENDY